MGVGARGGRARQPGSRELRRRELCDLLERRGSYAEEGASQPRQGSFRVPDSCSGRAIMIMTLERGETAILALGPTRGLRESWSKAGIPGRWHHLQFKVPYSLSPRV